jgi:hypothetical protein
LQYRVRGFETLALAVGGRPWWLDVAGVYAAVR